jgi:hypothetical protein
MYMCSVPARVGVVLGVLLQRLVQIPVGCKFECVVCVHVSECAFVPLCFVHLRVSCAPQNVPVGGMSMSVLLCGQMGT